MEGDGGRQESPGADGGPSAKEANKPDSPKPDTEVAPPLISSSKRMHFKDIVKT